MLQKRIGSIDFKLLDPKTIRKMSAIEIKTAETYDKDGYPMEEGLMDPHLGVINPGLRCKTCGQRMKHCPGHFGSFEMVRPVIHPKFGKKIEELLLATCHACGKITLEEGELQKIKLKTKDPERMAKLVRQKASKAKKCGHCNADKIKVLLDKPTNFFLEVNRIYPSEIRTWLEKIPGDHVSYFGFNTEIIRPEWLVLTALPVPPITIRPSITLESGEKSEDDLTHKLVDIIRINQRLKDNIDAGAPQLIIEDLWDLLQYHVTTYMDNQIAGVPPAKHRSGRPLRTITQRLKGKKGRFRHNLTGKRVNFAARSTVSPDPYLSINEVGVPEVIAHDLTVPERVTEWNLERVQKMLKEGDQIVNVTRPDGTKKRVGEENREDLLKEIAAGYKVERRLKNGDLVLFNRQPSLHRLSMLCHRVKIHKDRTLKLNPIVCKPYNADFDGDEMNMHVPQTEEGQMEARELMLVQNQIISPRYGAPIIIFDEDGISGAFALTHKSSEFEADMAYKYFYDLGITDPVKPDRGSKYSGKLIFSMLLPKDLTLTYKTKLARMMERMNPGHDCSKGSCDHDAMVRIENGLLKEGIIDEESLGEGRGRLADALARNYPPEVLERFYYHLSRIISDLLTKKGMTVGLDEYLLPAEILEKKKHIIDRGLKNAEKIVEQYRKKELELIAGRTLEESFEIKMMELMGELKDELGVDIMKEKLKGVLGDRPVMNSAAMVVSGARGSSINIMNIAGFWGQAAVREGRPKRGFYHRVLSSEKKGDVSAMAHGFITTNFMDGLTPKDYFFHAIGGRQGEVDTGVSTKVSGYLYRRLANSLKELSVHYDGTVRTSDRRLVQLLYGEDGVFPMKSRRGKGLDLEDAVKKFEGAGK